MKTTIVSLLFPRISPFSAYPLIHHLSQKLSIYTFQLPPLFHQNAHHGVHPPSPTRCHSRRRHRPPSRNPLGCSSNFAPGLLRALRGDLSQARAGTPLAGIPRPHPCQAIQRDCRPCCQGRPPRCAQTPPDARRMERFLQRGHVAATSKPYPRPSLCRLPEGVQKWIALRLRWLGGMDLTQSC